MLSFDQCRRSIARAREKDSDRREEDLINIKQYNNGVSRE